MILRAALSLMITLAAGCSSTPRSTKATPGATQAEDESYDFVRTLLFRGPDGLRITVAEERNSQRAFVRFEGTRSPIDGYVLVHLVEEADSTLDFRTTVDGKERRTLFRVLRNSERKPIWNALPPGAPALIEVEFDEQGSSDIDTAALMERYFSQGDLSALINLNRGRAEANSLKELEKRRKQAQEVCGRAPKVSVDWKSIDDDTLLKTNVSGMCEAPLAALIDLCAYKEGQGFAKTLSSLECRYGETQELSIDKGQILWSVPKRPRNAKAAARLAFDKQEVQPGLLLGRAIDIEKSTVCVDRERNVAIVVSGGFDHDSPIRYGIDDKFYTIDPSTSAGAEYFFEPRYLRGSANRNFRGIDFRLQGRVSTDEKDACQLECGSRRTQLEKLGPDAAKKVVLASDSKLVPTPAGRTPHALARDTKGFYYYVDRSSEPGREHDFQLYRGKLGVLKKLAMRDIVSDSKGEIFSSESGDLRLIVGTESPTMWVTKKDKTELLRIPVEENLPLIYNQLGVYYGIRLYNPCDLYGG